MPAENISAASVDYGLCRDRAFHNGAKLMPRRNVRKEFESPLAKKYLACERKQYEVPDALKELMSPASLEIISHFGVEAPYLLNQYCCAVEDALIEQMKKAIEYREKCIALLDEIMRLKDLVSIEDTLAE